MDLATTALSGLGGGLLRLAPEVIKLLDRKNERKHELALGAQQLDVMKLQSSTRLEEAHLQTNAAQVTASIDALRESLKGQLAATGIKFVDALNTLVRPVWTYYVLLTWGAVKTIDVWLAISRNMPWETMRPVVWSASDEAMLAMLGSFWFLDRVIVKRQSR